jgi:lipoprotein-releasing system ATP-binding protein
MQGASNLTASDSAAGDIGPWAIRVEGLGKTYRGSTEVRVFADMTFAVRKGERLALIGESGAGKSTLLHLLGGLDTASAGKIYFGDTELTALGARQQAEFRNRAMGFVWQTQSLLPEFTALENVMMPRLVRGQSVEQARPAAERLLADVGLATRGHHLAGELSGGEQQRVALARALAGEPQFLLADEPTGNLDESTAGQILDLLERLHTEHGLTSVIVTHSAALARRCHRTLRLARGGLYELVVTMEAG